MITVMKHSEQEKLNKFYEQIAKDSKQALIQLVSEAGWGKTSSLRTIIAKIKETHPEIIYKIFDVSQAWFHCAPVKYRQLITQEKWNSGQIANVDDCVYEMGSLSDELKRAFVGEILMRDWEKRYTAKLEGTLDELPLIAYIFEESNIFFGSYSFRKNDQYSAVFQNFVSVGRNYRQRGFLVCTAEQGEMAPSLRRRTRKIYGSVISEADLHSAKRTGNTVDLKSLPKYSFVYNNMVQRIPDIVTNIPIDYVVNTPVVNQPKSSSGGWWFQFLGTIAIFLLFWAWLMQS